MFLQSLRALVACGWFGIQAWIGGQAIYSMLRSRSSCCREDLLRRPYDSQHRVDGLPANPCLDAEQPQATSARKIAGTFAPRTPNDARTNTGNGMP